jgi:hypothetical protein
MWAMPYGKCCEKVVDEPSGLLPIQMPADMLTVETQREDVPLDEVRFYFPYRAA